MRLTLVVVLTSLSVANCCGASDIGYSLPTAPFVSFLRQDANRYGKIEAIRTAAQPDSGQIFTAIVSFPRGGGRLLTVLKSRAHSVELAWRIRLPHEMAVAGSNSLSDSFQGGDRVFSYMGCAPHDCGGLDGINGVAIFSLKKGKGYLMRMERCTEDRKDRRLCVSPLGKTSRLELEEVSTAIDDIGKTEIARDNSVVVKIDDK